jgi:hypothetical protein
MSINTKKTAGLRHQQQKNCFIQGITSGDAVYVPTWQPQGASIEAPLVERTSGRAFSLVQLAARLSLA